MDRRQPDHRSTFASREQNSGELYGTLLAEIQAFSQDLKETDSRKRVLEEAALQTKLFALDVRSVTARVHHEIYEIPDTQHIHLKEDGREVGWIPPERGARTRILRDYSSNVFGFVAKEVSSVEITLIIKMQDALRSLNALREASQLNTEISSPAIESERASVLETATVEFRRSIELMLDMRETLRIGNSAVPAFGTTQDGIFSDYVKERANIISCTLAASFEKSSLLSGRWISLRHVTQDTDFAHCSLGVLTNNLENPLRDTFPDWRATPTWYQARMQAESGYEERIVEDQDLAIALSHDTSAANPTRKRMFDGLSILQSTKTSKTLYRAITDPEKWTTWEEGEEEDTRKYNEYLAKSKNVYLICGTRSVIGQYSPPPTSAGSFEVVVAHQYPEYCYALQIRELLRYRKGSLASYYLEIQREGISKIEVPGQPKPKMSEKELEESAQATASEQHSTTAMEGGGVRCSTCGHSTHEETS